jgi:hypothetical protein
MRKVVITWDDKANSPHSDAPIVVTRYDDKGEYDASLYALPEFGSWLFLQFIWSWLMPK